MKQTLAIVGTTLTLTLGLAAGQDPFELCKKRLSEAACTDVTFLAIVESEIFESVDTADGRAWIASDGRFLVRVGRDTYLQTDSLLYSYSEENNQVTVETASGSAEAAGVPFIVDLDTHYATAVNEPGYSYSLTRKENADNALPDVMQVFLQADSSAIQYIEYLDINDELNRIVFVELNTAAECDSARFVPDFPDSADVVRLF